MKQGAEAESMEALAEAVVSSVEEEKGYVSTRLSEDFGHIKRGESITFSILGSWKGSRLPQKNQRVKLFNIEKFERGWRAESAFPIMANSSVREMV